MKNKFWIIVIAAIFVLSAAAAVLQYTHRGAARYAEIYQNGVLLRTVDLKQGDTFTIKSAGGGFNTIQIKNGAISVIDASCPDKICIHQGAISTGSQPIVCLPNKLVIKIKLPTQPKTDAIAG